MKQVSIISISEIKNKQVLQKGNTMPEAYL